MQPLPLPHFYQRQPLIFAHRGARQAAPENTLPAFELAAQMGADGIELDVQLSADGVPVVIHDPRLDRTSSGRGPVSSLPLDALRRLDAGAWFAARYAGVTIPTLEEVLTHFADRLLVNIELKIGGGQALSAAVIQAIRRHGVRDRVLISSFSALCLRRVRRLDPEVQIGFLYAPRTGPVWRAGLIGRYQALHPHHSMVSDRAVEAAHRRGLRVNTWTVNEPEPIRRLAGMDVDLIFTDVPDVAVAALQR